MHANVGRRARAVRIPPHMFVLLVIPDESSLARVAALTAFVSSWKQPPNQVKKTVKAMTAPNAAKALGAVRAYGGMKAEETPVVVQVR